MDEHRLNALLNGEPPTLDDFGDFVALAERLPTELLWNALHKTPNLHPFLRHVIQKNLEERIPREGTASDVDRLVQEMERRFPGIGQGDSSKD